MVKMVIVFVWHCRVFLNFKTWSSLWYVVCQLAQHNNLSDNVVNFNSTAKLYDALTAFLLLLLPIMAQQAKGKPLTGRRQLGSHAGFGHSHHLHLVPVTQHNGKHHKANNKKKNLKIKQFFC